MVEVRDAAWSAPVAAGEIARSAVAGSKTWYGDITAPMFCSPDADEGRLRANLAPGHMIPLENGNGMYLAEIAAAKGGDIRVEVIGPADIGDGTSAGSVKDVVQLYR